MRFLLTAAAILLFRGLDLFTTWLASPDLTREINPLYRAMGWRRAILWNLLCVLFAIDLHATVFVCVASFMCSTWNLAVWRSTRPKPQPKVNPLAGTRCRLCNTPYEAVIGPVVHQDGPRSFICDPCLRKEFGL